MDSPALRRRAWAIWAVAALGAFIGAGSYWLASRRHERGSGDYPELADWSSYSRGGIHFSGYVFRDRDRDGVLGGGDQPMARIALPG